MCTVFCRFLIDEMNRFADINKVMECLCGDMDINTMDVHENVACFSYMSGLLQDYVFQCFLSELGMKAAAFCILKNLELPTIRDTFAANLKTMLDTQYHAFVVVALRLINRHSSAHCIAHIREKLLSCIRQWLQQHNPPSRNEPEPERIRFEPPQPPESFKTPEESAAEDEEPPDYDNLPIPSLSDDMPTSDEDADFERLLG